MAINNAAQSQSGFRGSEYVRQRFVGRELALQAFSTRFAYRHMKNCIYYYGGGGLGKTWLLKRIIMDNLNDTQREVTPIVDFFDTQNHSKRGLQASLEKRLDRPEEFTAYHDVLDCLDQERARKDADPGVLSSLEKRADRVFVGCCQQAALGRELILLFDTFEKVQNLEAGRWLLAEFLPEVRTPIIAIAGRPSPAPAVVPDNVQIFELAGLSHAEAGQYVRTRFPNWDEATIASIHDHTGGAPLIIDLLLDLPMPKRDEFIAGLANLPAGVRIQDTDSLKCVLVQRYHPPGNPDNWPFWIMAFLKRRFDLPMLEYIAQKFPQWFPSADVGSLYGKLSQRPIVKEYPALESHLLHDEAQRLLEECILVAENEIWQFEIKDQLYRLVVEEYYPRMLEQTSEPALRRQYQAEQSGYLLDRDPDAGLQQYQQLVAAAGNDNDLEELLWGEVRDHLGRLPAQGLVTCRERGVWLRKKSLYLKAGQHYADMLALYPEQRVSTSQSLGFAYMRQGRLEEARTVLTDTLDEVGPQEYEAIAYLENVLGQVARRSGQWGEALDHYARCYKAASKLNLNSLMAGVLVNRGYLYSLQGQYAIAEKQCKSALELLKDLSHDNVNENRRIYAWLNLGTVNRHQEKFDSALECYSTGLDLARRNSNQEAQVEALQGLGINQHLQGRGLRRKGMNIQAGELTRACRLQLEAWNYLTESLRLASQTEWEGAIADGLNRLGKVYREIFQLEKYLPAAKSDAPEAVMELDQLKHQAVTFNLGFDLKYGPDLIISGAIANLGWRERAAQLFEISALAAEDVGDFHRALDSLVEMGHTLLWVRQIDLVPQVVRRIERIIGIYEYQEALFAAMARLMSAEIDLIEGRVERALSVYQDAYIDLANAGGYANYLLIDRLRDLAWRLQEDVPVDRRLEWCDRLEDRWLKAGLAATHPEMIDLLENARSNFLKT